MLCSAWHFPSGRSVTGENTRAAARLGIHFNPLMCLILCRYLHAADEFSVRTWTCRPCWRCWREVQPVRGFQTSKTAYATIKGFEVMHAVRKGQAAIFQYGGGRKPVSARPAGR
jgi:hypothetical protein